MEHEIGNIKKCLAAAFDFVALVVPEEKRIAGFIKAVQPILSEAEFSKVRIVAPEGLFLCFSFSLHGKAWRNEGRVRIAHWGERDKIEKNQGFFFEQKSMLKTTVINWLRNWIRPSRFASSRRCRSGHMETQRAKGKRTPPLPLLNDCEARIRQDTLLDRTAQNTLISAL